MILRECAALFFLPLYFFTETRGKENAMRFTGLKVKCSFITDEQSGFCAIAAYNAATTIHLRRKMTKELYSQRAPVRHSGQGN